MNETRPTETAMTSYEFCHVSCLGLDKLNVLSAQRLKMYNKMQRSLKIVIAIQKNPDYIRF